MSTPPALSARGMRKRYGDLDALDGCDLEIRAGGIHGLLGPNGAGKSTAVKAFATLISLDAGEASVAGFDVRTQPDLVRRSIGLIGQDAALDEVLGGRQNLVMFGRLFGLKTPDARRRADELLAMFRLEDAAERAVSTYSGGMRRRLDIAAGLILRPAVLFLDEPTTGLDPRARGEVWAAIRGVAGEGTTVLLTTQYLDEADQLASRISVMDHGRVIAEGSPEELKRTIGGERVSVTVGADVPLDEVATALAAAAGGDPQTDPETRTVTIGSPAGQSVLVPVVHALGAAGIEPEDLVLRRPTLDEVFLTLTAKELQK